MLDDVEERVGDFWLKHFLDLISRASGRVHYEMRHVRYHLQLSSIIAPSIKHALLIRTHCLHLHLLLAQVKHHIVQRQGFKHHFMHQGLCRMSACALLQ